MSGVALTDVRVTIAGRERVSGASLRVGPGEWLAVIGPNGAGKSTLLRAIAGLAPYDGTIEIGGREAHGLSTRERALAVALVPQAPLIPLGITVADYVLLGRTPHLGRFAIERRADHDVVRHVIGLLDLEPFAARRVESLSGGERQRTLLARALAQAAPVLLLDEPTTALDIGHQQDVLELVDRLRREHGLAVITTMHDLTLAGRYPDRLALMAEGRIVVSGTADDVLTEANLAAFYGAAVTVVRDDQGVAVIPRRAPQLHS